MLKHKTVSRQQRRAEARRRNEGVDRETCVRIECPQTPEGFGYFADIMDMGVRLVSKKYFPTENVARVAAIEAVQHFVNSLSGVKVTYIRF